MDPTVRLQARKVKKEQRAELDATRAHAPGALKTTADRAKEKAGVDFLTTERRRVVSLRLNQATILDHPAPRIQRTCNEGWRGRALPCITRFRWLFR